MLKKITAMLLVILTSLSILSSGIFTPALAAKMQEGSMYVNTANGRALRFRSGKSTDSSNVICQIPYRTKVFVLEYDATWAKVKYNGAVGYVMNKYLTIARPMPRETLLAMRATEKAARDAARKVAAEAQSQKKAQKAILAREMKALKAANRKLDHSKVRSVENYDAMIRASASDLSVKLYQKPSLVTEVLDEYEEGVRLVVLGQNKDWALVYNESTDMQGYMLLEYLEPDLMD